MSGASGAPGTRAPPRTRRRRNFGLVLGGIVVLGVVVRIAYIEIVLHHVNVFADSIWYYQQGRSLRHGGGFVDVFHWFGWVDGHPAPKAAATAYWPPGYPSFLAVVQAVVGDGLRTSQLAGCATGAATIALSGLLGRAIAGRTMGLLGALLVALSPFVIAVDGSLMSETLYVPLVLLALLLAQRARTRPTAPSWCALGAVIGLAALTRQDALLLVLVAMIPAAVLSRERLTRLVPRVGLGVIVTALVVTPWIVRNDIQVGVPQISTVSGIGTIAAANCPHVYHGDKLGWWAFACTKPDLGRETNEAHLVRALSHDARTYALAHMSRWPLVGTARVLRVWGLWNPGQQTRFEGRQTRSTDWQRVAWLVSTGTLFMGIAGLVVLARRRRPIAMLVAPMVMATLVALISYGNPRYDAAAAPAVAIAAAAALLAIWEWLHDQPVADRNRAAPGVADSSAPASGHVGAIVVE